MIIQFKLDEAKVFSIPCEEIKSLCSEPDKYEFGNSEFCEAMGDWLFTKLEQDGDAETADLLETQGNDEWLMARTIIIES